MTRVLPLVRDPYLAYYLVSLPLQQFQLAQLSLRHVIDGLFPATYNSKKGGGVTFDIDKAAPLAIMSEPEYSFYS